MSFRKALRLGRNVFEVLDDEVPRLGAYALSLPEILSNILSYLKDDCRSLRNSALVNSVWFEPAIDILWAHPSVLKAYYPHVYGSPTSCELHAVGKARRQTYASKIRHLLVSFRSTVHHSRLSELRFPRTRELTLLSPQLYGPETFDALRYRLPALEKLNLHDSFPASFLDGLHVECPRLSSFTLIPDHFLGDRFHDETLDHQIGSLGRFFKNISLKHIEFTTDYLFTDDCFVSLGCNDQLETLTLNRLVVFDPMRRLLSSTRQPFKALSSARLHICSPVMSLLGDAFPRLTILHLLISCSRERTHLDDLTIMPVRTLTIEYCDTQWLRPQDLFFLRSMPRLESLDISMGDRVRRRIPDLTKNDFDHIFSRLPHLRRLVFELDFNLSKVALSNIAQHCPRLCHLAVHGDYELQSLNDIALPLFLEMRLLHFGKYDMPTDMSAEELGALIFKHAPELNVFDMYCLQGSGDMEQIFFDFVMIEYERLLEEKKV